MKAEFHFEHSSVQVDLDRGIDLSEPFTDQGNGTLAWGIEHPRFSPVEMGDFVGSVEEGGSVNFRDLFLNPHGNGTHTECLGHITKKLYSVNRNWAASFHRALLIELEPSVLKDAEAPRQKGDHLFLREQVEAKLEEAGADIDALIVRTHPYPGSRPQDYSGSNPPYFHPDAMRCLREREIQHLLTDLPSVDKEDDGGDLLAHHTFWNVPDDPDHGRTITELIRVPEEAEEGDYLLELQVAPVENDAAPSRPVIHPILG